MWYCSKCMAYHQYGYQCYMVNNNQIQYQLYPPQSNIYYVPYQQNYTLPPCNHCYCSEGKPDHKKCCKCGEEMHTKFIK